MQYQHPQLFTMIVTTCLLININISIACCVRPSHHLNTMYIYIYICSSLVVSIVFARSERHVHVCLSCTTHQMIIKDSRTEDTAYVNRIAVVSHRVISCL